MGSRVRETLAIPQTPNCLCLRGEEAIYPRALRLAAQHSHASGASVFVVDGANRFDVYVLCDFADSREIEAEALLERFRVVRAFTCHQLVTLVCRDLKGWLGDADVVLGLGLCEMFLDEDLRREETDVLFARLLEGINELKAIRPLVLAQPEPWKNPKRRQYFEDLLRVSDSVVTIETNRDGQDKQDKLNPVYPCLIPQGV